MMMINKSKKYFFLHKKHIVFSIIIFIVIFIVAFIFFKESFNSTLNIDTSLLTSYSEVELEQYDGTDPNKPIYLVYQGFVYDVSAGREFYETGGSYHYLAGKDSTAELNLFGGEIIKRKYPIIGVIE